MSLQAVDRSLMLQILLWHNQEVPSREQGLAIFNLDQKREVNKCYKLALNVGLIKKIGPDYITTSAGLEWLEKGCFMIL